MDALYPHRLVELGEVGLGGRLDTVNLVDADLAVITPIGLDHQAYLGDRIELIAMEKAGIMKPGVPVVIGFQDNEVARDVLIDTAERLVADCEKKRAEMRGEILAR